MNLIKHTHTGYDRLEIRDPQPEELFSGELLRAIVTYRSLPWAWRDPKDRQLIRIVDDYGTALTYRIAGYDRELDTYRMRVQLFAGGAFTHAAN